MNKEVYETCSNIPQNRSISHYLNRLHHQPNYGVDIAVINARAKRVDSQILKNACRNYSCPSSKTTLEFIIHYILSKTH